MREAIKKAVIKLFPELSAGLHLDRFARVVAINDEPSDGGFSESFRPRYAVDVEILTPDGETDKSFPIYKDVPLPASMVGDEKGVYGFPDTGAIVVLGFAYGRADCPIVRQVYPAGVSLPSLTYGEILIQKDGATYQKADENGNWLRTADESILDDCYSYSLNCYEKETVTLTENKRVQADSKDKIGGTKSLEALGGVIVGSGGFIEAFAIDNINLASAKDMSRIIASDFNGVIGGNQNSKVKGQRDSNISGNDSITVGGNRQGNVAGKDTTIVSKEKEVQAKAYSVTANTFTFKTHEGSLSFFPLLLEFMQEVRAALDVLATHTHREASEIVQGGAVKSHADNVGAVRSKFDVMSG